MQDINFYTKKNGHRQRKVRIQVLDASLGANRRRVQDM